MNASFTAAIVVRSLLAALGEVCVAGLVVGWVVVRLVVCWPVSVDVVVAEDMKWFLMWFVGRGWELGCRVALAADSSQPLADSSLNSPDSSQALPIRPCPCPIRPFLGFVA